MKKLFVLMIVLAISSMATAATVTLTIIGGATPGDYQGTPSYDPSDTIQIALVISGITGSEPWDVIGSMRVDDITSDGGGTASNPGYHAEFDLYGSVIPGTGTSIIEDVTGSVGATSDGIGNGNIFWFDFHVPVADYSTIITIDASGMTWKDLWDDSFTVTDAGVLEIHVTPEPMTIALLGIGGLFLRRRK